MRTNTFVRQVISKSGTKPMVARHLRRGVKAVRRACFETLEDRRLLSFSPAVGYAAGQDPQSLVVADFNGDVRPDLAVLNSQSSTVSVLLGNGNGTFQPAANFATGANPRSLAVGDFNSDGKPDLATADDGGASVLLNNGAGAFQAPTTVTIPDNPLSVAVGDFNGDGKLDLAATSSFFQPGSWGWYAYYPGYYVSSATVLLGNGAGSFTPTGSTRVGNGTYGSVTVADFNSDGKQDLATSATDSYYAEVLFGTTTGVLSSPNYVGGASRSVTAGDANGDGKADLITTSVYSSAVTVFAGNGVGGFGSGQSFATGESPASIAIGDFNGDGKADVATANWGDGTLSVLLGNGSGTFTPPINLAPTAAPVALAAGDFNGDGRPDIATANGSANTASVLLNDGTWPALDAPRISIGDVTVTEGNTGTVTATFTVSLSAAYSQPVTVSYATSDGTATAAGGDYQATSGTLTFAPGETSKQINVAVNGDRIAEDTEFFAVRLADPTNAFIGDGTGVGTILDDEPRITIEYASVKEGNTGTTPLNFVVRLSAASDVPVSVNYSTAEGDTQWQPSGYYGYYAPPPAGTSGADFQPNSGTLTFAPGETEKTIPVLVNGDYVPEPDEVLSVDLSGASGGGAVIANGHALGTIIDDEPYASITGGTITEGNSGSSNLAFTVTLSAPSDVPIDVTYATADGTATVAGGDYQAKSGTVTFAPGVTSQVINVAVNGDRLGEDNEYFLVNVTGVTSAHPPYSPGYGFITDDEPRISIVGSSITEGNSGTKGLTFTVTLSTPYDQPVTVKFATADGTATVADHDYAATSGTLTFAAGQTTKTITVFVYGDKKKEPDEYFSVLLSGASANSWLYNSTAWGNILNDDGGNGGSGHGKNR